MTAKSQEPSPLPIGEREFVMMMALTQALQAAAIDAMLPALGLIAGDLQVTDPNQRQLVIAVFLFGVGFGAFFPGALSDRFGRKPVLLACIAGFAIPAIGCALATDFETLLFMRGLQAVCSGGLAVLPFAIIRDRVSGDRMARMQSLVAMMFMTVPMLAPALGLAVLLVLDWRWIFWLLALVGAAVGVWVWLRLPETLHEEYRQPFTPARVFGNMGGILLNRSSIGYVIASAFLMAGSWGFINSSQQLVGEHFGAGKLFPFAFGAIVMALILSNFINSRIVERFGARRVSHMALLAYIGVAAVQVLFAYSGEETIWHFIPLMALNMGLIGFVGANFMAIALQPFGAMAGAAASTQTFVRTVSAGTLGAIIGQFYDGSARPLATALLLAGTIALVMVLISERGRLFRRVYPPGASRPQPETPV